MIRSMPLLFPLLLIFTSCAKKENGAVEPRRMIEDTINITAILKGDDPNQVQADLDLWLQYYPDEVNRVFPDQGTTALGLLSQKYFASAAQQKVQWLSMMEQLLDLGANPNIFFPFQNQRRGLLHLALEQADLGFARQLIEKLGTIDPPLVFSCDASLSVAPVAPLVRARSNALNLNLQEDDTRLTPLHYAVRGANPDQDFIEYLLLQGASPDIAIPSLNLGSPYQMVAGNPLLAAVFEKYSGPLIRYQSRMNSFLNDEIQREPGQRNTLLDLAKSYKTMVEKEGFQDVQDINRVVDICNSQERLNLLGYSAKYLLPSISTRVVQAVKARNDSLKSLIVDYGASICSSENLTIRDDITRGFREIALKDFVKETLATHSSIANAPVKNYNRSLWCEIIKTNAIEGGCWIQADESLAPGLECSAS